MEKQIYWEILDSTLIDGKVKCKCVCGIIRYVSYKNLKNGLSKSCGCCKKRPLIDLIEYHGYKKGDKINRLTIIDNPLRKKIKNGINNRTGNTRYDNVIHFRCQCECGNIVEPKGLDVVKGYTKSCGCTELGQIRIGKMPRYFYRYLIVQAKQRNIEFDISFENLSILFDKQNSKCALSGIDIQFNTNSKILDGNASLDRIDSSKPYTLSNVQWVDVNVNYAKLRMGNNDFIDMCKRISEYNSK